MVLGHESSGIIESVGSEVKNLKAGDRVAMEPGVPCRHCPHCKGGFYNLCPDMAFASTPPFDGTLAKVYRLPGDFCYKLPDDVSLEAGALVEPTAVAVHVVRQGGVNAGHNVVIFGAGPVGLLIAGVSRAYGANKIVVVDIQESRLQFAKDWVKGGCTTYVSQKISAEDNANKIIEENGLGEGADVVIDASGAEPSVQTGLKVVRKGGTYVQAGMGKDQVNFPILEVCTREVRVMGSFRYKEGDYALAVKMIANGQLDVERLISKKVSFGDAEEAFGEVKEGKGIKVLIEGVKDDDTKTSKGSAGTTEGHTQEEPSKPESSQPQSEPHQSSTSDLEAVQKQEESTPDAAKEESSSTQQDTSSAVPAEEPSTDSQPKEDPTSATESTDPNPAETSTTSELVDQPTSTTEETKTSENPVTMSSSSSKKEIPPAATAQDEMVPASDDVAKPSGEDHEEAKHEEKAPFSSTSGDSKEKDEKEGKVDGAT